MNKDEMFRVGQYINTHGIKGEIKVFPTTDDINRFDYLKEVYMDTRKDGLICLEVSGVKYFKNLVILKFKNINNINDIEKHKGSDLYVTRENAIPLEEDEYYIADILGAKVVLENGEAFGELVDVLQTGANDVYAVKTSDDKEVLLPVIDECVLDINIEEKVVTVHIMDGLL